MKGLLYKDMLMLLRQYRNFVFIFLVFLIVGVIPGNESYFNIYAIFLLSVFSLSSLRADEMSGWNRYCDILPLSGKTVVTSYYVENYSLLTLGVLLYLLLSLIIRLTTGYNSDFLSIALIMTCFSFLISAISIPLTLKFGSAKGPVVQMILIGVIVFIGLLIINNGNQLITFISGMNRAAISLACLAVTLLLVLISWKISVHIYNSQERA